MSLTTFIREIDLTSNWMIVIILILGVLAFVILVLINRIFREKKEIIEIAKKDYIDKALESLSKIEVAKTTKEEVLVHFAEIIKEFYKEELNINHELTLEEISQKLKEERRILESRICEDVSKKRYASLEFSPVELFNEIEQFKKILRKIERKTHQDRKENPEENHLKFEEKLSAKPKEPAKRIELKKSHFKSLKEIIAGKRTKRQNQKRLEEKEKQEKAKELRESRSLKVNKKVFQEEKAEKKKNIKKTPESHKKIRRIDGLERVKYIVKKHKEHKKEK